MKRLSLIVSIWLISYVAAGAQAPTKRLKPTDNSALDSQAMATLNRMVDFLKTVKNFKITSETSIDEVVDTNMKVQKHQTAEIVVQLPSRAYAHVHGDDKNFKLFYDGTTLALHGLKQHFYSTRSAPSTVKGTLEVIRADYGITFPLADFIDMAVGENLLQNITAAGSIGTSEVNGVECDHIAVRQPEVDWQVWIERGDTPLPRRYVITSKKEATQPQYMAQLTWDLSPGTPDSMFTFNPPADARRIPFGRVKEAKNPTQKPTNKK